MNMLRKLTPYYRTACTRLLETASNLKETLHTPEPGRRLVIEPLSDRELVRVQGEEVVPFLQGLITNDMYHLQEVRCGEGEINAQLSSMYTMFLNKAGRVLYDSIIYRTPNPSTYLIECDKCVSNELRRHLRLYRVRRKIQIDTIDREFTPWIAFNPDMGYDDNICIPNANSRFATDVYSAPDPRVRDLGLRILTTPDRTWRDLSKLFAQPGKVNVIAPNQEMNYRLHRYRCGVGEGVRDLPPGKCFPLEANCDFLHGVSFHKGCYIGQELTARVYHTGVVRKRLLPLRLTMPLKEQEATVKSQAGANVGIVRGVSFNRALALLRVDQALHSPGLMVDGEPCYVEKPRWWPVEMSSKARISEG